MDVTENGLRAAVKALTDVVAPAIDRTDPLAAEQLRLVVDYLQFVRSRLDLLYDRDRFELQHNLSMARTLKVLGAPLSKSTAIQLEAAISAGAEVQASVGTSMPALKTASAALAAAVRDLIREAGAFEPALRRKIENCVLEASEERINFERAWYLPLGFEPEPQELEPLTQIIADATAGATQFR